jgi:hypothetical protein
MSPISALARARGNSFANIAIKGTMVKPDGGG